MRVYKMKSKNIKVSHASQIHEGAKAYFRKAEVETLDIDSNLGTELCNLETRKDSNLIMEARK